MLSPPCAATVRAREQSVVWAIDRDNFKKIVATRTREPAKDYVKFLNRADVFSDLHDEEKMALAGVTKCMVLQPVPSIGQ